MLNTIVLIAYCLLMTTFLAMGALAFRHTARYSYINNRFKAVAWAFGIIALSVIIFSVFLLVRLLNPNSTPLFQKTSPTTNIDY